MVRFINIKKRRDLTADLKVRIDTGALNDFKKMKYSPFVNAKLRDDDLSTIHWYPVPPGIEGGRVSDFFCFCGLILKGRNTP